MKRSAPNIASEREYEICKEKQIPVSSYFGEDTFNEKVMQEKLPKEIQRKLKDIIDKGSKLDIDTANAVAHAMKEWAIEQGATHYCHWFQPMTGTTAEKHESFIELIEIGKVIERFSGKQLVQGEPDASSFPSGGIRSTFEARGYTAWDISSPAFIIRSGLGITLCIPTAFISYTGEALDKKTPLLRSIGAVNGCALRLMRLLGNNESKRVYATLGPEQEYFLIDKDYYYKRQDLLLTGRTIFGAPPAKGQQLEDHYFGSIKERILSFMHDIEEEFYKLGIPAKTRHNEVAPSQFEFAPIFEEANLAVDHNQLVMDMLHRISRQHNLTALLHEKPFAGINGSGKHLNWSLTDDIGNNLLNPGGTPQDNIQFLLFLIATVRAVFLHADILRASIASSGNDHRLGANEAPPAIISVFLGEQLSEILENIEQGAASRATDQAIIDLRISSLPVLSRDNTDRNRTSPFAFTGNKFEFRAVGSSQSISFPATVLNLIVAESLDELSDRIEGRGGDVKQAAIDVLREEIKNIRPVLFMGDNYSTEWEEEAVRRGLPNKKTTPEAIKDLITDKSISLFEKYGVLSAVELRSRYTIRLERYTKEIDIEAMCLYNIASSQILPAAIEYQGMVAASIDETIEVLGNKFDMEPQKEHLKTVATLINDIQKSLSELLARRTDAMEIEDEQEQADYYCSKVKKLMESTREKIDQLEVMIDDELWQIPKLWEILFIS
jgi:glutamine synthetase